MSALNVSRNIHSGRRLSNAEGEDLMMAGHPPVRRPYPFSDAYDGAGSINTSSAGKRSRLGTPAPSWNTDAYSNMLVVDSEEEVSQSQSSMWILHEGHTPSELPSDFLEPLSPDVEIISPPPSVTARVTRSQRQATKHGSRQFWKAGDFTGSFANPTFGTGGMDHARVHPKFLHSNATSHKWVLGAVAELLDNAIDEVNNGATFVRVDVMRNPRNGDPMLLIEDDGGGMDPDCIRRCMSLGYSAKSKLANTIGQYGNGFKTSTMRLGADVIVFSRSGGSRPSESIGMMSYTFLTVTGQDDIVVPIVDFQIQPFGIRKLLRSTLDDWVESMEAIEQWSPYSSQAELVNQFKGMSHQGTKVVIYNLWEDEEGHLELDFSTDPYDIQIRGGNRDEKNTKLAERFPSCRHYLTYRHSLRSYASILYLRLPSRFMIYLRGKQVHHHSLRNEMMLIEEVTYKPQCKSEPTQKDAGQVKAVVTLGFLKDAREHLDVQGFSVYHKNRLIKPFWRIWKPSDTRGRGIIGILEANFVEPAHDKQGFERTIVLSRLETRLVEMQKSYWSKNCHKIGYTNISLKKDWRPITMDDSPVAISRGVEKGHMDVLHTQGFTRELEMQGVSSAMMVAPMQDAFMDPVRLELQTQNFLGSMDMTTNASGEGVEKSNNAFLHTQDSAHERRVGGVSSALIASHMQDSSLAPAGLDLDILFPPVPIDITSNALELESPCMGQMSEGVAFATLSSTICDVQNQNTQDCCTEAVLSLRANAGEEALSSRERSDIGAGSPEGNEAGRLKGDLNSVAAVIDIDAMGARSESVRAQKCVQLSEAASSPEKVADTTAFEQPNKDIPSMQRDGDAVALDPGFFLEGVTLPENTPCAFNFDINVPEVEALDSLRSSPMPSEAHDTSVLELDDLFESLTSQNEASGHSSYSDKVGDVFSTFPTIGTDLSLPNASETATLENNSLLQFNSLKMFGGNEAIACTVRNGVDDEQEGTLDSCQHPDEHVVKDSETVQMPPNEGQVSAGALAKMDYAATTDFEVQEGGCLQPSQALEKECDKEGMSSPVMGQLLAVSSSLTATASNLEEQEGPRTYSQGTNNQALGSINNCQSSNQGLQKGLVQVPTTGGITMATRRSEEQEGLSRSFVDLNQDLVPARVPSSSSCDHEEDLTCRILCAEQKVDVLRRSIDAMEEEADDLREQLRQQRQRRDHDMKDLSMQLERALSCLQELKA